MRIRAIGAAAGAFLLGTPSLLAQPSRLTPADVFQLEYASHPQTSPDGQSVS